MNLSKALLFSGLCAVASSTSVRGGHQERELIPRIIGGEAAREGRYSYAVSLQDGLGHFCGGSLIAPDIVLSAAHCMQYGAGYRAVVGRHFLDTADGDEVIVKAEIPHQGFDWGTTDNDFMILVLDRPVAQDMINLVHVSPDVVQAGTAATVMGWGDTHPADDVQTIAEELMETEVFVVSNEECDQSRGTVGGTDIDGRVIGGYEENYHNQITSNMMCAEDHGESDSCQGDSGGPLVIHSGSGDIQIGVVSWGASCAHEDFPGVYSRASAQYEWIREKVCEGSSDPPASFQCDPSFPNVEASHDSSNVGGWTTIIEEDFKNGLGLFGSTKGAKRYSSAMNRGGVVRIAGGGRGNHAIESSPISLKNSSFATLRIKFSFYAVEMEHSDNLCLDYEFDNGSITGEKCWSSLHAFENSKWYDDKTFTFAASGAQSLIIRLRVGGNDERDDVLIDSIAIQGLE